MPLIENIYNSNNIIKPSERAASSSGRSVRGECSKIYHKRRVSVRREHFKTCPVCQDSGIVCYPTEYPNLEDRRCCPQCEVGTALAAKISEIISSSQAGKRVQVA